MTTGERLLEYFKNHKGETLNRDDIFSEVWGYKQDSHYFNAISNKTRTLDVHISKLRKEGHPIETIHGVGYRYN